MRPQIIGSAILAVLATALLAVALVGGSNKVGATISLPKPDGEVVLTVTGNLARTNAPHGADFDMAMLERLGITRLQTATPWTEGAPEFRGILVREILNFVGAEGATVRAVALNDYSFEIPLSDFDEYQVILANAMDGRTLTPRDKGPLWIVYPWDEFSVRDKQKIELRMVWQLVELQVQ